MTSEAKLELTLALTMLKRVCVKNDVSIAVGTRDGMLKFFDTTSYIIGGSMKGIEVNINDLVGWGDL